MFVRAISLIFFFNRLTLKGASHRVAWLRDWPYSGKRFHFCVNAWIDLHAWYWKRWKMCVISWNHSKTCVISWKACFLPNFSVFALKSEFFIDCVNAWKWQKICVIAWSKTPLGGLFEGTKGSADPGEASQNERSIKRVYRPFGWVGNGVRPRNKSWLSNWWVPPVKKKTHQAIPEGKWSQWRFFQPTQPSLVAFKLYQI